MPWLGHPLWLVRHVYLAFPGPNGKQEQKSGLLRPSEVSDSLRPHRLSPITLLCPWDSPGKNTAVGSVVTY